WLADGEGWVAASEARAHRYGVTAAHWAPAGRLLASSGVDGSLRVWSYEREGGSGLECVRTLAAAGAASVRSLCWAGSSMLAAGHDDGALCVWRVAADRGGGNAGSGGRLLARLRAHDGALHALAAPAHAALLMSACTQSVLKVFDLAELCRSGFDADAEGSGRAQAPVPLAWQDGAHDMGALCAAAAPAGGLAATAGHDALIRLWRISRNRPASSGGRTVWSWTADGALPGHAGSVVALSWARGVLASAALDRSARLWAVSTRACLHVLHAHPRYLTAVMLAPDLSYLLTGSNDKTVKMWSLGKFNLEDTLEPPCNPLAHYGVGDLEGIGPLAVSAVDSEAEGIASEVDEKSGETTGVEGEWWGAARRVWRAGLGAAANCIAVHDDLIAVATSEGAVHVLRWQSAQRAAHTQHVLRAHRYPVLGLALGVGGALLLSGGLDEQALLWDVQMGCVLRSMSAGCGEESSGVRAALVSPHRPPLLALVTDCGQLPVWRLEHPDPAPA
ncbi:hypothetical protein ACJJTC_009712, partial [Scirpophaga incertulas]